MDQMNTQEINEEVMHTYLAEIVEGGNFENIPMIEKLKFAGPMATSGSAEDYRKICASFAQSVRGISVRSMLSEGNLVHSVYDVDMGLPTGPLPTSQIVEFVDGAFSSVEVIFDAAVINGVDSAPLRSMAGNS